MELSNSDKYFVSSSMERIFGGLDLFRHTFYPVLVNQILNVSEFPRDDKNLTKRYFVFDFYKQMKGGSLLWKMLKIMVRCAFVLMKVKQSGHVAEISVIDFLARYPQFSNLSDCEINLLMEFRGYMKLALEFIPAEHNKTLLMKICGYLESAKEYVTGSGQSLPTSRRVQIFEQESGITPVKREKKRVRISSSGSEDHEEEEMEGDSAPPAKRRRSSPPHITLARVQRVERPPYQQAPFAYWPQGAYCEPEMAAGSDSPVPNCAMIQNGQSIPSIVPEQCESPMPISVCGSDDLSCDHDMDFLDIFFLAFRD